MTLVSIDPGANSGVAYWELCILQAANLVTQDLFAQESRMIAVCETVVCEIPVVYPGKTKNPNDLITLAYRAGCLAGPKAILVQPVSWKYQLPDDILYKRIRAALTSTELQRIPDLPESKLHNVLDAIGIGLHYLKRLHVR
jgi:hypothetical protein